MRPQLTTQRLVLLLAIGMTFIWLNYNFLREFKEQRRQRINEEILLKSRVSAETVASFFSGAITGVSILEKMPVTKEFLLRSQTTETALADPHYTRIIEFFKAIDNVFFSPVGPQEILTTKSSGGAWIASALGDYLINANKVVDNKSIDEYGQPNFFICKERPWWPRASSTNGIAFSDSYLDIFSGVQCVSAMRRMEAENGELIGAVGIDILLPSVTSLLTQANLNQRQTGTTLLIERNGNIVFHSDLAWRESRTLSDLGKGYEEIEELLLKSPRHVGLLELDGEPTYYSFEEVRTPNLDWTIVTLMPKELAENASTAFLSGYMAISVVNFVFFLAPIFVLLVPSIIKKQ